MVTWGLILPFLRWKDARSIYSYIDNGQLSHTICLKEQRELEKRRWPRKRKDVELHEANKRRACMRGIVSTAFRIDPWNFRFYRGRTRRHNGESGPNSYTEIAADKSDGAECDCSVIHAVDTLTQGAANSFLLKFLEESTGNIHLFF